MSTAVVKPFLEESLPEIADYLDIDLDDFDINVLRGQIMVVSLWAATKALENDDHRLIHAIHSNCFDVLGDKDKDNQFQKAFLHKSEKYNEAWDERSGGEQILLALCILSEIFNERKDDKALISSAAFLLVVQFVFITMENVLKARAKITLIA